MGREREKEAVSLARAAVVWSACNSSEKEPWTRPRLLPGPHTSTGWNGSSLNAGGSLFVLVGIQPYGACGYVLT